NPLAVEIYDKALDAENAKALGEAERLYKRALELDPKFCDAMDNLGQVYRMQGDDASAIPLYQESARLAPKNPVPHQSLANAYIRGRRYEDSLREWDALIAVDATNPRPFRPRTDADDSQTPRRGHEGAQARRSGLRARRIVAHR